MDRAAETSSGWSPDTQAHLHTLDMTDVTPVKFAPGLAPPSLLVNLALESLDLASQVGDDAGVLGDVVGDIEQVLLHLRHEGEQSPQELGLPFSFFHLPF